MNALALLLTIGEEGRLRPSEIAERQQGHPSLITRQVRELEGQGFVAVEGDRDDRCAWLVSLTSEGWRSRAGSMRWGWIDSRCSSLIGSVRRSAS